MKRVLDIPYELRNDFKFRGLVKYDGVTKTAYWEGDNWEAARRKLQQYAAEDFSYGRWVEDEMNKRILPPQKGAAKFTPRPHQKDGAKQIYRSYSLGIRGHLLADKTGIGKTLTSLVALSAIAKSEGYLPSKRAKLLIVCPKTVIPQWQQTLRNYPTSTALMRPMVINYEQLLKLLKAPPQAKTAKRAKTKKRQTATRGKPTVAWDYIVLDEAHKTKNYPSSTSSVAAATIAGLNQVYAKGKSPFVIFSTATPGATPLNFALMAGLLAPLISKRPEAKKVTPDTWAPFLQSEGFAVKQGKVTWSWAAVPFFGKDSDDPKEKARYEKAFKECKVKQREDTRRIGKALTSPNAPFTMRSPTDLEGWPEQQYIPLPLALTPKQKPIYEEAWTVFREWLKLTPAKSDPQAALVQMLRYRQKASLLKAEPMSEQVIEWVKEGNQVYISCEFIETVDEYRKYIEKAGIPVSEISGRTAATRTEERLAFQTGKAKVCISTVVQGISLHSGEILPDGTKATPDPRISVISDLRLNNLDTDQSLGRAHRDGENSLTYFPSLADTIDEKVVANFTGKQGNMSSMLGSTDSDAAALENLFRDAAVKDD